MNMILILSEQRDTMTDEVCMWLNYWNKKYLRVNIEDFNTYYFTLSLSTKNEINPILTVRENTYFLSRFKIVWFRRGEFSRLQLHCPINCFENDTLNRNLEQTLSEYRQHEYDTLIQYIYNYLRGHAQCFNFPNLYNINKIVALDYAKSVKLNIPRTLVSSSKGVLQSFFKENRNRLITKSIGDWCHQNLSQYSISLKTKRIENISEIPSNFDYSLFQECIEKQFEVRTFVWDNRTYSAAIYSPFENETKIDFRSNYDAIRITPFKLPKTIERKLFKLMKKLCIESGSADFIVTSKNEYYFLEINPVGQFEFLDKICNYNIPTIIAKTLSHDENNKL